MKIAMLSLLVLLIPLPSVAEDHEVFDKDGIRLEYWKEKGDTIEIYDNNWSRKGYIKKGKDGKLDIFDKDWNRKGYIDRQDEKAK